MTGQTLLPMPMGIEQIFEEEWKIQNEDKFDAQLKSNIEVIVTKWLSQIGDVLAEESTRANDVKPLPSAGTYCDCNRIEKQKPTSVHLFQRSSSGATDSRTSSPSTTR